jgi:cell division protein FtsB
VDAQAMKDSLKDQAAQLEQDNGQLKDKIDGLGSVDSVEDIAKEELDLVDPDSVIIQPES